MAQGITAKCQKCGREIPTDKAKEPCPDCGDMKRNYVVTMSAKLGIKVEMAEKRERVIIPQAYSYALYALLIVGALVGLVGTFIGVSLGDNVVFIVVISVAFFCVLGLMVWASILIKKTEIILGDEVIAFKWKSLAAWIGVIRQPFAVLLFALITIYEVLNLVGLVKSPLNMDLVMLSATFGGLVLAAGSFQESGSEPQKQLTGIAKLFIVAAFSLFIFNLSYSILNSTTFDPTKFSFDYGWISRAVVYIVFVCGGLFSGAYLLSTALVNIIVWLVWLKK